MFLDGSLFREKLVKVKEKLKDREKNQNWPSKYTKGEDGSSKNGSSIESNVRMNAKEYENLNIIDL